MLVQSFGVMGDVSINEAWVISGEQRSFVVLAPACSMVNRSNLLLSEESLLVIFDMDIIRVGCRWSFVSINFIISSALPCQDDLHIMPNEVLPHYRLQPESWSKAGFRSNLEQVDCISTQAERHQGINPRRRA